MIILILITVNIYRMLYLSLKMIPMVKITPRKISTTRYSPTGGDFPLSLNAICITLGSSFQRQKIWQNFDVIFITIAHLFLHELYFCFFRLKLSYWRFGRSRNITCEEINVLFLIYLYLYLSIYLSIYLCIYIHIHIYIYIYT